MKRISRQLLVGLAAGMVAALLSILPPAEFLELKGYDFLHAFRGRNLPPEAFVLVAIDEPSFAETGMQWPWPRSLHARLTDRLSRAGAAVIAFDVLFAEASLLPEDSAFAGALGTAGNIVLASDIETSRQEGFDREMLVEPYSSFSAVAGTGISKVVLDRDNVVRRFYPVKDDERLFPEQIAAAAQKVLKVKGLRVPGGAYISFRHPPGSFRKVSYYQALDPDKFLPQGFFQDKIVIIGKSVSNATGATSDYFATPFLQANDMMSGAELQATMTENIMSQRFVTRAPAGLRLAILLLLALCGALIQLGWRPVRGAAAAALSLALYLLVVYFLFERRDYWIPTFASLPAFLIPYGYAMAEAYISAERKRSELRRIFSHYLSPAVLDCVLAAPDKLELGGSRVEATVLFSDIAGFTSLAETMPPEDVSSMLNLYFSAAAREIFSEEGTIDKYIGDSVMAFWGAPLPAPDHALRACRAALAMQQALDRLNQRLTELGCPKISTRIGINTGMVIAGNIGSEELYNYTVLGDAVNLASRLEGANKEFGTGILISEHVYDKVRGLAEVRPLGRIRVKGRGEDVGVYELLSCGK